MKTDKVAPLSRIWRDNQERTAGIHSLGTKLFKEETQLVVSEERGREWWFSKEK